MAIDKNAIPKEKNSISLFGQKKKSQAEKIVDELSNKNTPAKIIRLDNGTEKVINLVNGKTVYSGKIETKDNSVGNQLNELLSNRRYPVSISGTGDPTYYDPNDPANEYMDTPSAVRETFDGQGVTYTGRGGSYTFSETPTTDVYSEGYFPEEDNLPSDSVVTTKQLFGDDTNYVPNTDYPRRNTIIENKLDEDRNFLQRTGDNIMKVFTQLKTPVQVSIDPVTGENVARSVPMVGAIMDSATIMSPMSGMGAAMGTVSDKLLERQESDARFAVEGFSGYAAIQAIDLGTGEPVTITASPGFGGTVSTNQNVVGPLAYNGSVFADATAVAAEAIKPTTPTVTSYADRLYRTSPRAEEGQKEIGRPKVQVNPLANRGEYNDQTGEVNLGAGRFGQVTGAYLSDDGTYQFTTGRSSLVTDSKGNPVTTGTGIVYSGLRGNIVSSDTLPDNINLLGGMESGNIKTDDFTLGAIAGTQDYIDQNTNFNYNYPTIEDYSTSSPLDLVETEFYSNDSIGNLTESGVTYSGPGGTATFSETLDSDVYSEGDFDLDFDNTSMPIDNEAGDVTYGVTDNIYSNFQDSNQYQDNNDSDNNDSGGTGGAGSSDMGFSTAMGGRIGKQEGGVAFPQGVSQIVQGAGFIAPQGNATDQQTIADDIPMEAEEGDFIINAPAAEFAGRQDIVDMIVKAINSLREKGVDIQYGNPKIPVEKSVKLAVSRNEVYVPKVVAEEIGYDKLQKINKRGQKEVQRRQEEAQSQAARGGFVSKAKGDVVVGDKSNIMGADDSNFLQDLGRFVVDELGDKIKGFISPREEPTPVKKQEDKKLQEEEKFPEAPPPKDLRFFGEKYPLLTQALERVETGDANLNVQTTKKFKENPYRFTQVTIKGPKGSSAFGLRQLTYTGMQDILRKHSDTLNPSELKYAKEFIDMGKQRVNFENTRNRKTPFVYEGSDDDRIKISIKDKADKLGISTQEYIRRLSPLGEGLIPTSAHRKHYNTFADIFFKDKLKQGKSLDESLGLYYGSRDPEARKNYVRKFKDALGQIKTGVKELPTIEPKKRLPIPPLPTSKPKEIQSEPNTQSFLSPTMG